MKKSLFFLVLLALSMLLCDSAEASSVFLIGDGIYGDYSAKLTYTSTSSNAATLNVLLTNTTAPALGGYLTALAFNNPGDKIDGVSLSTDPDFIPVFSNNNVKAQPYGYFDIGAVFPYQNIQSCFQGNGGPTSGIGAGITRNFTFTFTGDDLDEINVLSFVNELSHGAGGGGSEFFIARFKGFNDDDSDKVPGTVTPEPVTISLLGLGLAGLIGLEKKRRVG
jgi:hypothetical protein